MIGPLVRLPSPPSRAPARPAGTPPSDDVVTPEEAALAERERSFDVVAAAQAEAQRERNVLRDLFFDQLKSDDEYTKKWLSLI